MLSKNMLNKVVFVSSHINDEFRKYLNENNYRVITLNKNLEIRDEISTHPDIFLTLVDNEIIFEPFTYEKICDNNYFISAYKVHKGSTILSKHYPMDIAYNVAIVGNYAIHNTKYTDDIIKKVVKKLGKEWIHINQGYSKCSIVIANDKAIITSDKGIYNTFKNRLDVLLIKEGYVKLKGMKYGFLGGASGKIGDTLVFYGNLESHIDFFRIVKFLEERNIKYKYFKEFELEDIGSIIEIPLNKSRRIK
ncbi:DUF6873 family GME fold protein [Helicovermis profundi]|uniref:DUF6873 domain-containing protein n=1 Tax=Helicovermis profundi TaxID=3065157 RepID=A0AAU9E265_9FIRM|nr:hypothetical protein HLPR_09300 [Clostridia bacterium S502]